MKRKKSRRRGYQVRSKTMLPDGPLALFVNQQGQLVIQPVPPALYKEEIAKIERYQATRKPDTSLEEEEEKE